MYRLILCIMMLAVSASSAPAQEGARRGIYLILDGSGSMWGQLPDSSHKITVAKQVVEDFVSGDFPGSDLALRVYGHRRKGDCTDSELVVPFSDPGEAAPRVREFMAGVNPLGKTPISLSLREALADMGDREGEIILISDGIETCDEDPCALVRAWREKNVRIKVHVVGLGLDEKARGAMQCISEAAGTEYHDAQDAAALAASLTEIQRAAAPAPTGGSGALLLKGLDPEGKPLRVTGTLLRDGAVVKEVSSNGRHVVEAGSYELKAGVRTKNGTIYKPVTQTVEVAETVDTTVEVRPPVPPSVKALFTDEEEQQRGSQITAFRDGREVFHFRWIDEVYLEEGDYEFRAKPNADNDLSVTESFAAGEHKRIEFVMVRTVRLVIKAVAAGSGIRFRNHFTLWQNGEEKYRVHVNNGADVKPGAYDAHLESDLTPYVHKGLEVSTEAKQQVTLTVPVGHITVIYQKADGSREEDKRYFLGRGAKKRGRVKQSGQKIPLTMGTYNIVGWRGNYNPLVIEVRDGEDQEIVLRDKP